jgi:hypothetical protein
VGVVEVYAEVGVGVMGVGETGVGVEVRVV